MIGKIYLPDKKIREFAIERFKIEEMEMTEVWSLSSKDVRDVLSWKNKNDKMFLIFSDVFVKEYSHDSIPLTWLFLGKS